MKTLSKFIPAVVALAAVACNNAPEADVEASDAQDVEEVEATATYALVTDGDEISWEGYKTYADGAHQGTIQVQEGEFSVEGADIVGGTFIIDMNSIDNKDLAENAEYKAKLEGHLKSADFFHTEQFPTATFTVTKVEESATAENGATHKISGNLKMRDQEKNITIPATINVTDETVTVSTPEFVIDRTNWGVEYASETSIEGLAKENAISDNIKLKLDLTAKKG